ncbi:mitochondrial outer membrane protein porin 5-like isoform X3 [Carex rostrata]
MKGPGLFSDIGKKAKDLLTRDYSYDQRVAFSTVTTSGLSLTATSLKKGASYLLDLGSQYKYNNALIDIKFNTDSNVYCTLVLSEILPNTQVIALAKFSDYNDSGKLEVQYFHHHASLAASLGLDQSSPVVELSGTLGTHGIAFGAEAGYNIYTGDFTKYNVGIGASGKEYNASVSILADKGDIIKAAYVHHLDDKQKTSAMAEFVRKFSTNENTFTVGGLYSIDPQTTVKTRLNNSGKMAALIQHEIKPNSFLTISATD